MIMLYLALIAFAVASISTFLLRGIARAKWETRWDVTTAIVTMYIVVALWLLMMWLISDSVS